MKNLASLIDSGLLFGPPCTHTYQVISGMNAEFKC